MDKNLYQLIDFIFAFQVFDLIVVLRFYLSPSTGHMGALQECNVWHNLIQKSGKTGYTIMKSSHQMNDNTSINTRAIHILVREMAI